MRVRVRARRSSGRGRPRLAANREGGAKQAVSGPVPHGGGPSAQRVGGGGAYLELGLSGSGLETGQRAGETRWWAEQGGAESEDGRLDDSGRWGPTARGRAGGRLVLAGRRTGSGEVELLSGDALRWQAGRGKGIGLKGSRLVGGVSSGSGPRGGGRP